MNVKGVDTTTKGTFPATMVENFSSMNQNFESALQKLARGGSEFVNYPTMDQGPFVPISTNTQQNSNIRESFTPNQLKQLFPNLTIGN